MLLLSHISSVASIKPYRFHTQPSHDARVLRKKDTNEMQIKYLHASEIILYDNLQMRQTITYEVPKETKASQLEMIILKPGCLQAPNDAAVKAAENIIVKNDVMNMKSYDEAVVPLEINMENMKNSDLWDVMSDNWAVLNFCIKIDLHASNPLPSMTTNVFITFDLSEDLTSKEALEKQDFNRVYSDVNDDVTSCLCDDDYKCHPNHILSRSSELQICVMAPNFETLMVDDVKISQDGHVKFHPVKDGTTQPLALNSGMVDKFRNGMWLDNMDKKNSMAVLRTRMISSFFEDPVPPPIAIEGLVKLSRRAIDQDPESHNRRRVVYDEKNANFVMFIDIDTSTNNDLNAFSISNGNKVKLAYFICIVSVLLVAIAYKGRKNWLGQEFAEEDDFLFFDNNNQRLNKEPKFLRRSTFHESCVINEITEFAQLGRGVSINAHIGTNGIDSDDRRPHLRKTSSALELGDHNHIPMEDEHKAEFITELELV